MSIRSEAELEGMRAVGRIVALALAAMKSATRAGESIGERGRGARVLDVTFEKNGFMADAAATVAVPPVTTDARRLIACGRAAVADDGWTPSRPPMALWPPTTSTRW